MPNLNEQEAIQSIKLLNMADSGAGKTSALAALANAGYKLRIVDFDNGHQPLVNLVDKDKRENVDVCVCTDMLKTAPTGQIIPVGEPDGWSRGGRLMTDGWKYYIPDPDISNRIVWGEPKKGKVTGKEKIYNLGHIHDWGQDTVLVWDSLSLAATMAMRFQLHRAGDTLRIKDGIPVRSQPNWGAAMEMLENILGFLYSDAVKCHVIVNTHIDYITDEVTGSVKGQPLSLGKKLTPKIPRYFNTVISTQKSGAGQRVKRKLRLTPIAQLELKVPVPEYPDELSISSGYPELFRLILGDKAL